MEALALYVSVPIASFRVAHAREFFETYPFPPPATVYGMLLALVGEENRLRHEGAEIAIGLLSTPQTSVVLRTTWRVKDKALPPGTGSNKKPDFQELLTDVRLRVDVRQGRDASSPPLVERLQAALDQPASVHRFGALSLGESTHVVDEIRRWKDDDAPEVEWLVADNAGDLTLPVWPDHVGGRGTTWGQFRLASTNANDPRRVEEWCCVRRARSEIQ